MADEPASAPLRPRLLAVLRAAPFGLEFDEGNGDPHQAGRFRYHGGDGRVIRGLWHRGLLTAQSVGPDRNSGSILKRTPAGDAELQRAAAVSTKGER